MKYKGFFIMLLCLIVCSSAGIGISAGILSNKENNLNIDIKNEDVIQKEWNINLENIYPGESEKYTINFNDKLPANTKISLTFLAQGEQSLASFIDVNINYSKKQLESQKLSEYIGGDEIVFNSDNSKEINIVYSMDSTVGNEAQNTSADFVIMVKISNEGSNEQ